MFGFSPFASKPFADIKSVNLYSQILSITSNTTALFVRQVGHILSYLQAINNSVSRAVTRVSFLSASTSVTSLFTKQVNKTISYISNTISLFGKFISKTISINSSVSLFIQRAKLVVLTVVSFIPVGGLNTTAINTAALNGIVTFKRIGVLAINYMSKKVIRSFPIVITVTPYNLVQRGRIMTVIVNTTSVFKRLINKTIAYVSNIIIIYIPSLLSFKIYNNERLVYLAKRITTITTTRIRTLYYTLKSLGQ